jgi:hypothetical protein
MTFGLALKSQIEKSYLGLCGINILSAIRPQCGCPDVARRVAEAPAKRPVEMRDIGKTDAQRNVADTLVPLTCRRQ